MTAASWPSQGEAGISRLRSPQPHQSYGTKLGTKVSRRLRGQGCPSVMLRMSAAPALYPELYAPVPLQPGCFQSPSAVLCHPATPSRCSLGPWLPAEHHLFLVPGQASSWQSPLAQSGRELYHSACVGQSPAHSPCRSPWALHPGSSAVRGERWLIVEQEHVLQMPPYSDVQAALQGRDPHRSFGCSHFPVSPVLCSGG